jgi:conjugal transfer pilus assembly protein TraB
MTDQASEIANGSEQRSRELHEPVSAGQLNERTAKRQRMLLAGIATVILAGTSWIIFGSDHSKKAHAEGEAETIETASLVNRNLSQRENLPPSTAISWVRSRASKRPSRKGRSCVPRWKPNLPR